MSLGDLHADVLHDLLHHPLGFDRIMCGLRICLRPKEDLPSLVAAVSTLRLVDRQHALIGPKPHSAGMHSKQFCRVTEGKPFVCHVILYVQEALSCAEHGRYTCPAPAP
jgi:hypothetical protein